MFMKKRLGSIAVVLFARRFRQFSAKRRTSTATYVLCYTPEKRNLIFSTLRSATVNKTV